MKSMFKNFWILFLFLTSPLISLRAGEPVLSYGNPVVQIYDGCIERFMGYFYAMGTGTTGKIYYSRDMVKWLGPVQAAFSNEATWLNDPQWSQRGVYSRIGAGDIVYRNGVFHLYFNGIGHSYASAPLGPYKEQCILEPFDDYGIDAQLFQDEDGEIYYIKKVNGDDPDPITGVFRTNNPGPEVWAFHMDSPFVRKGIQGWMQMKHQPGHPLSIDWTNFEGPEMFKYHDRYYCMFSPNRMSARTGMYVIGCGESDGPMNFTNHSKYPHAVVNRNMEKHHMIYKQILPSAEHGGWSCRFTFTAPASGWENDDFDDSEWTVGNGGFGIQQTDLAVIRGNKTIWSTSDIWIRRKFTLDEVPQSAALKYRVDADCKFYINGNLLPVNQSMQAYALMDIDPSFLKKGDNLIAVTAENMGSGSTCFKFVDFGLFDTYGKPSEPIIIGPSQANMVPGPNGFERWVTYKAFFNNVSSQGIDRAQFYGNELVVDGPTTIKTPGYHPRPALPTFVDYFDDAIYYPFRMEENTWTIGSGILKPNTIKAAECLLRRQPETYYRYEVPFRIRKGHADYAGIYACYQDSANYARLMIYRDAKEWEWTVCSNGILQSERHALPEKFEFLDSNALVSSYEEPFHTLTIYRNGVRFRAELDYFLLKDSLSSPFVTAGNVGLLASSSGVAFDAVQYTAGWDEWKNNFQGWKAGKGTFTVGDSGLILRASNGEGLLTKGDKHTEYEFSTYCKLDKIPTSGEAGLIPVYVDSANYLSAVIDYQRKQLCIRQTKAGVRSELETHDLAEKFHCDYTVETYPVTQYRYDFRCEKEIDALEVLWFEGSYPYLGQNFKAPVSMKIYALVNDAWQEVSYRTTETFRLAWFNKFTFAPVKTKAVKIELQATSGYAVRPFSAYFEALSSSENFLRVRRENDKLYLFVNDSLKSEISLDWAPSSVGFEATNLQPSYYSVLCYQLGSVPVDSVKVKPVDCATGDSVQLQVQCFPGNATNQKIVWVSSNPEAVSVSPDGMMKRHQEGTDVTITAWSADGGLVSGKFSTSQYTGVQVSQSVSEIRIYPTLASDYVYLTGLNQSMRMSITNMQGQEVYQADQVGEKSPCQVDVQQLGKGSYFLTLFAPHKQYTFRFCKK